MEQVLQKKSEERIEKEVQHFQQELERLKTVEPKTPEIKQYVEQKTTTYETKLNELPKKVEQYKVETNKSGFIYIISNNFNYNRKNLYKIGMTRRNDVEKRIKELYNAAVMIPFNTVCVLFSDDAPTLETNLHKELEKYRAVPTNKRKEFFELDKEKLMEIILKYDMTATFNFEE